MKNIFLIHNYLFRSLLCLHISAACAQAPTGTLQNAITALLQQGEIYNYEYGRFDSTVTTIGQLATFEELLALAKHENPLLRVAAIHGLLQRDENGNRYPADLKDREKPKVAKPYLHYILKEHFRDTATVQWRYQMQYEFKLFRIPVGELCLIKIGNYWHNRYDMILSDGYNYPIPKDVKRQFDSLLLLSWPNPWTVLRFARIRELEPVPAWYPAIRRQVKMAGDEVTVCYLAKYQKPADIDLILNHLPTEKQHGEYSLPNRWTPFQYFRHPRLFAYLVQHQPTTPRNNPTTDYIAAYQTPEAAAMLDTLYAQAKSAGKEQWYALSSLSGVIAQHFAPIYAPLYWKMLVEHPENSNIRIPDQLWETHADSLAAKYEDWKTGGRGARERATAMFPKLSTYLAQTDARRRVQVVVEQIKPGQEPRMAQQAWETIWQARNTAYTSPLFVLLEREPLPEIRFFICKIILHQPETDIRRRLTVFFQQHPERYPNLAAAEKGGGSFSDFYYHATEKK